MKKVFIYSEIFRGEAAKYDFLDPIRVDKEGRDSVYRNASRQGNRVAIDACTDAWEREASEAAFGRNFK
jgi:hypothetical protein